MVAGRARHGDAAVGIVATDLVVYWVHRGMVQRPEMHSLHHGRGLHADNYGNLALWDLVFGTFPNPRAFVATSGFWDGASRKMLPMLLERDVGQA